MHTLGEPPLHGAVSFCGGFQSHFIVFRLGVHRGKAGYKFDTRPIGSCRLFNQQWWIFDGVAAGKRWPTLSSLSKSMCTEGDIQYLPVGDWPLSAAWNAPTAPERRKTRCYICGAGEMFHLWESNHSHFSKISNNRIYCRLNVIYRK